ncbi:hypothetical protein C8J57DRAFT_1527272 [Mycena rebaudengoi]|nr:hypothetical protein C8J57DRAFT_1527272 [Mycena rebaudengoi]
MRSARVALCSVGCAPCCRRDKPVRAVRRALHHPRFPGWSDVRAGGARVVRFCALPAVGNVVYADVAGGHTLRSVGARLSLVCCAGLRYALSSPGQWLQAALLWALRCVLGWRAADGDVYRPAEADVRAGGQAGGTRATSVMYAGGGTLRACALPLGHGRWLLAACGVTLLTCAQATPATVMPSAGGTRTTSWHQRTPPMHTTLASSTAATYNHGPRKRSTARTNTMSLQTQPDPQT